MTAAALVMAGAPRPGHVKERLEPLLGPDGCAALEARLIEPGRTLAAPADAQALLEEGGLPGDVAALLRVAS